MGRLCAGQLHQRVEMRIIPAGTEKRSVRGFNDCLKRRGPGVPQLFGISYQRLQIA